MTWFQFLIHFLNAILPALGVALITTALAKLVWRQELADRRWWALAAASSAVGVIVILACLMFFGRDGRMATYLGLCAASALTLWWLGFVRGR
jgi:uncharacterized membrane protein